MDLLTLRAAELLRQADVVVYDRLIQSEVLKLANPAAEVIYMGKTAGGQPSRQQEINELLVRKAREGKIVVRLKGGDPFLLGRGGEEAEYLVEHGVRFEAVPGVSSSLAAPLGAGIPVTHRDIASAVAIVTGQEARQQPGRLDWAALARVDTLVFLMCVQTLEQIASRLISHGKSPQTPAAIVQKAYWSKQQVTTAPLERIAEAARQAGIEPPAVLVVGEVVRLRQKLAGG